MPGSSAVPVGLRLASPMGLCGVNKPLLRWFPNGFPTPCSLPICGRPGNWEPGNWFGLWPFPLAKASINQLKGYATTPRSPHLANYPARWVKWICNSIPFCEQLHFYPLFPFLSGAAAEDDDAGAGVDLMRVSQGGDGEMEVACPTCRRRRLPNTFIFRHKPTDGKRARRKENGERKIEESALPLEWNGSPGECK